MKIIGRIVLWIMAAIMVLIGIAGIWLATTYQQAPLDMAQTACAEIVDGRIYKIENLMPVTYYASYGSETEDDYVYTLATCFDANDQLVLLSLMVDTEDPLFAQLEAYMNDETAYYGDMALSCYAYLNGEISDTVQQEYYDETVEYFIQSLTELGIGYYTTSLDFDYICDVSEDYTVHANAETGVYTVVGVVFLALAALLIFMALRKPKTPPTAPVVGQAPYTVGQAPYAAQPTAEEQPVHAPMEDPADLTNRR